MTRGSRAGCSPGGGRVLAGLSIKATAVGSSPGGGSDAGGGTITT
jgi:hypothetical protein